MEKENSLPLLCKLKDFKKTSTEHKYLVIKISTTWCKVCKTYQPIFAGLATKYPRVLFCEIPNLDKWDKKDVHALPFKTHTYPRFALMRKGKVEIFCNRADLEKSLKKVYC